MFEHVNAVGDSNRNRTTGTAFTDHNRDNRYTQFQAHFQRAGNGFCLTALFRTHTRIGTGSINECDYRQFETVSQFHDTDGFTIAFGTRGTEIMFQAGLGVIAFFLTEHRNSLTIKTRKTGLNGLIFGKVTVTGQRREFCKQAVHIIQTMRTVRMTGDLHFLPRGEFAVNIFQRVARALFKAPYLITHLDTAAFLRQFFQFEDLTIEICDGFFEIKVIIHMT